MQEVRLQSGQSQLINNCTYCQIQMFVYKQIIQTTVCLHHVDMHYHVCKQCSPFVCKQIHCECVCVLVCISENIYLFTICYLVVCKQIHVCIVC